MKKEPFWVKNVEKWVMLKVIPLKRLKVELYHNQVISTCSLSDNAKNGRNKCDKTRARVAFWLGQK